jgi:hypothetical protein
MATATHSFNPLRELLQVSVLVALSIVLASYRPGGAAPYVLLVLIFFIALDGYRRTHSLGPPRPWECNDEP